VLIDALFSSVSSDWHAVAAWFEAGLVGSADPWLIALVLVLTTLLLEDVAIASWGLSLAAVGGGIAGGDLVLYALGIGAARVPWLRRRCGGEHSVRVRAQVTRRLPSAVLLARVIPGLRLVTYTACGFLQVPFGRFSAWVLLAVAMWTAGLYGLSVAIGAALARHLGLPLPVAVALPILLLAAAVPLWRRVHQRVRSPSAR
jgi:membrane protein DedA with SNARE-associated domain